MPRRPRKGQPGHRSRQAGARRRPNDDRLHAHARRMERRYTKAGQKEKKMNPEETQYGAADVPSQARVEHTEAPAPEQPAAAGSETQDSLDPVSTPSDVGGEG